jgi:hypothetical protein
VAGPRTRDQPATPDPRGQLTDDDIENWFAEAFIARMRAAADAADVRRTRKAK